MHFKLESLGAVLEDTTRKPEIRRDVGSSSTQSFNREKIRGNIQSRACISSDARLSHPFNEFRGSDRLD